MDTSPPIWELRSARERRNVYGRELVLDEYFASRRSARTPLVFTSVNERAPLSPPGVNMLTRKRFSNCRNTATSGPFSMNYE